MPRPCSRWPWLAAVLLTTVAAGAPAKPPEVPPPRTDVDPMRAPVPPPPAYRSTLSDEEYAEKYADVAADLGPVLAAAAAAVNGATVTDVGHGSAAEKAGLRVGDVIVAVGGHRLDEAASDDMQRLRAAATGPVVLTVASAGKARAVTVPPGRMGLVTTDAWLLEGQYAHDLPAGVAACEQVRVAARCCRSDPDLALAALARASGPGASGPVVSLVAAAAATADCQYEDAIAYAMDARGKLPAAEADRVGSLAVRPALATFRWRLARELGCDDDGLQEAIDAYEARPHTAALADPVAAGVGHFVGQLKHLQNLAVDAPDEPNHQIADPYVRDLRDRGRTAFDAADGSYALAQFGPVAANVDCWVRYHYKPNKVTQHDWQQAGQIGLWAGDRSVVSLDLLPDGHATVLYGRTSVVALDLSRLVGKDRTFTVRLTTAGDRIEYVIDGRRVFYGPLPSDLADEAGRTLPPMYLGWVGLKGEVDDAHYRTAGPLAP